MKKFSLAQRKLIYVFAIILAAYILFWMFIYLPQARKLAVINKQLSGAEAQIFQINQITAGRPLEEVMRDLGLELKKLSARFPSTQETFVGYLSESARKLRISIKSISLDNEKSEEFQVPGLVIMKLPISLKLTCEYKALAEYLHSLRESAPFLIRVNQVAITGQGEGTANLEVNLKIVGYLSK